MVLNRLLACILCLCIFHSVQAQKGKDGGKTVSASLARVNEFTALTASVAANSSILNVTANGLNTNSRFTSTLTTGDLVMIIQMQGAKMNLGTYAVPWQPDSTYGKIYDYSSCGNYEFAEVKSTISNNQIELTCGLTYSYSNTGKTQIVRVPRYNSLNVTGTGTLTTDAWNGSVGGILAVEVDGNTTIDGLITTTGLGFRGGAAIGNGGNGNSNFVTKNPSDGAEKGEGVGSDRLNNALAIDSLGKQCKGAPANGGGGGNANNCGGGGGGNGGNINNWSGYGITNTTYSVAFNLEWPTRSSLISSGGGKGGYGTSTVSTNNPNSVGPHNLAWGSTRRPSYGGFGGRPLHYGLGKLFMGGGGGAGHMSTGQSNGTNACSGGAGGGLIYFLTYGVISGTGSINSNGANGNNAFGNIGIGAPQQGIDGAGGAGAGGTIILRSSGTISGITANANGGNGGNQIKTGTTNSEGQGPGGGGSGGYITATNTGFTQNVNGGSNGTTNASAFDTEFPMNGATSGDAGTKNQLITSSYSLTASANQTICTSQSANLTASSTNNTATIEWYNSLNGNAISSGTVYTTPNYTTVGTYTVYAGSCPGLYRLPIIITVTSGPTITVNNPTICPNQSITVTAGGASSYTWNTGAVSSSITVSPTLTTIYTVSASSLSCTVSKTATVTILTPPTISVPNATICAGTSTVLTASGSATSFTWMPGTISTPTISANSNITYSITGSNGVCTNSTTATVTVASLPTVSVQSATICAGTSTVLTASGSATSFTWMPGNVPTSTISANSTNTYTITGSNGVCTNSTTATVTDVALPTLSVPNATICASTSTVLTASGTATSFTWMPGNVPTSTISATSNTIYTIIGSNGVCTNTTTATVTVVALPTVSVPSATICAGTSTVLTASGTATSFTWMPGTITTPTISANSNATYNITGSNGVCTNTTTATISVTPTPTLTVNSPSICSGQTATLTVSGAISYTWNPGNLSGTSITATPTMSTTYTITGADGACSASITSVINVTNCNNVCSFSLGKDTAFCSPMNYVINGPAGYTSYSWSPTGATSQNMTATNTGTYICTGTMLSNDLVANGNFNLGNTMFTSNYVVPASPGPFGLLSNPGTYIITTDPNAGHTNFVTFGDHTSGTGNMMVCNGSAVANDVVWSETITVNPNTNYNFSAWVASVYNTSAGNEAQLQFSINGSLLGAAYSAPFTAGVWGNFATNWNSGANTSAVITIVDQNFTAPGANDFALDDIFYQQVCSYSDTIVVTENASPNVSINAANPVICNGYSTSLTANGASTYTLSGGITNGISFSPTVTTTYSVTGTSVAGCTNSAVQTITVNSIPTLSVTNGNICSGQTATIIATGANTYTWSNSVTGSFQTVSPTNTTTYNVQGTDVNGCVSSAAAISTVTVTATPTVNIVSSSICAGQTATLVATGATSFTWSTTETTQTINPIPALTTTYSVFGYNVGCTSPPTTATVFVTSSPTLNVNASVITGCVPLCINFTDQTSSSCSTIAYNFGDGNNGNSNNPNHCYAAGGNYTVTATCTNTLGCSSTYTMPSIVQVLATPVADFIIQEGNIVTLGSSVNFNNTSINATSSAWDFCNGISISTNAMTSYADTGSCCVTLLATNATCTNSVTKCITIAKEAVVVIPNVFTPNGDQSNDLFKVSSSGLKTLNCTIYDRWGLKMHEWDAINGFWDGSAKSGSAPAGTYFYIINYTDQFDKSTTEKGFLNLFRD
ncbi:MAG: gliding motility-associated C-terminal domain-containing protein [Bacteroidota bacterium]